MGFFFLDDKAPKPSRKARQKRDLETLNRLGCQACPLNHAKVRTPKMAPTLVPDTDVYFLGEAPGEHEDEISGRPFTGPSGALLRQCLDTRGLRYSFDNVIRDRPPQNRDPTITEVEACRFNVVRSIEAATPKVIVGLGRFALQWMLNTVDMIGLRGRLIAVQVGNHKCWFLPTYHPSFILRTAYDRRRPLRSKFGSCLDLDVKRACAKAAENKPPVIPTEAEVRSQLRVFNGEDEVFEYLEHAKRAPVKAIDLETNALRPYVKDARILTCAISHGNQHFSFVVDHILGRWSLAQRHRIRNALRDIISDSTCKIAHNAPFEIEWLAWYFGKEVIHHEVWECTQLQAHFLDERKPEQATPEDGASTSGNPYMGLNFLCKQHYGAPFKLWFKVDRKNIGQSDLHETLLYNAADTLFTLRLWGSQTAELRTRGLYSAYLRAVPRQPTVALMQYLGMPVNQAVTKRLQRKMAEEIAIIQAEIESLGVVKQYVKDKGIFNPLGDDAIKIFKDYLKRKEVHVKDGERLRLSIDKYVLQKIDHPLAGLIVRLRNRTKMKSTYIDGLELHKGKLIYPDGHLHCNFNTTSTVTGRTSSDTPNMQNFPQRSDAWVREQIEPYPGHVLIAVDFGQLEMCVAAMCSKDPYLVKALWEDYDAHMYWASRLAALCPDRAGGDFTDPKIAKALRGVVKGGLVFAAIYGASNDTIGSHLGIDLLIVEKLMKEFWSREGLYYTKVWQHELLESYHKYGYVTSPSERRRHYPMSSNEAINAPIQCMASDIVVDVMQRLSYMAAISGKWYLHPRLNIHDDLTFIVPENKAEEAIATIIEIMLTPDFGDVINVPLSVEVKMGKNWFEMKEVGKFWSHKDL